MLRATVRNAFVGLLAAGILSVPCGAPSAGTHTISWSPVTTYADGTAIRGGKTATYSLYWATTPRLNVLTMFDYGLTTTSRTFDPASLGMAAGSTVYFTMKTTLNTGETSRYAPPRAWVVPAAPAAVASGISAGVPTTSAASPSAAPASSVPGGGNVSVQGTSAVEIVLSGPASPVDLRIGKVESSRLPETWRLEWDPVTRFANGRDIEPGQTVRYIVYWTRDPSLAAGNLVVMEASTSSLSFEFQPGDRGMKDHEKVFLTLRAVLDSGDRSPLSGPLPWRVSSEGPAAPAKGRIDVRNRYLKE